MDFPKIAVIIPAKDASRTIKKCLESVLNLDYPDYEVIVVDDGSSDITPRLLSQYKDKLKIITTQGIGPSAARNLAANQTQADYLAFTDSDCLVDSQWLRELYRGFLEYPKAVACGGIQRLPQDATKFEKAVFAFLKKAGFISDYMRPVKTSLIQKVGHNPCCNVIYRKETFIGEGGFLENFWPGEDVELDRRLALRRYRHAFNPAAIVYHYRPRNLKAFVAMMARYGVAQGCLLRRHGFFRTVQWFPFVSAILLVSLVCIFFVRPVAAIIMVSCMFLFIMLYLRDIFIFSLGLCAFAVWHFGFIRGFIKKTP